MIALLAKIFVRETGDAQKDRRAYGILCGAVGICLNVLLAVGKFLAGSLAGSVAVRADAFNNLSDAGSSLVTLVGFRLAGAKPDPQHPFGHGRMEYLSGLTVSAVILLMAYELLRESVEKILDPVQTRFQATAVLILAASIAVKCYMASYNSRIGKKIGSAAMRATATDCLGDAFASLVVLLSAFVSHVTGWKLDGLCGALVSFFLFYAGIRAARETLDVLLGQAPDEAFVEEIRRIVTAHREVCGMHDLIVHDYGPGRRMISLHAEVASDGDILALHDVIDSAEKELKAQLGCDAVIHMDPIVTSDARISELRSAVTALVVCIDEALSIHDFRVVEGPTHTNLIFDVVVPHRFYISDTQLQWMIGEKIKKRLGREYDAVMQVDRTYVGRGS